MEEKFYSSSLVVCLRAHDFHSLGCVFLTCEMRMGRWCSLSKADGFHEVVWLTCQLPGCVNVAWLWGWTLRSLLAPLICLGL